MSLSKLDGIRGIAAVIVIFLMHCAATIRRCIWAYGLTAVH